MNGLYVYSIMAAGSLFALVVWISRRREIPLFGPEQITFLCGAFAIGAIITTGLSVRLAQQNSNPAPIATPSDHQVVFEEFSDTSQILDNNGLMLRCHTRHRKATFFIMRPPSRKCRITRGRPTFMGLGARTRLQRQASISICRGLAAGHQQQALRRR